MEVTAGNLKWHKDSEFSAGKTRGILIRFKFWGLWFRPSSNIQIKHPTRCNNQSYNLLFCCVATAQHVPGIIIAHHQEHLQTAVSASGFHMNVEMDVFPAVYGLLVV
jgi:hypothetical protein